MAVAVSAVDSAGSTTGPSASVVGESGAAASIGSVLRTSWVEGGASALVSGDSPGVWSDGAVEESLAIENRFQLQSEAYIDARNQGTLP